MSQHVMSMNADQLRAYQEWLRLRGIAEETKTVEDCIASGKAFANFHYLFVEDLLRPSGQVIPLPRGNGGLGGAA